MKIEFADEKLKELLLDKPIAWLPINVIKSVRRKLPLLASAESELDLINFRSFYYKGLSGKRKGQKSIRLTDKWRLVFKLDIKKQPMVITILSVEDYH